MQSYEPKMKKKKFKNIKDAESYMWCIYVESPIRQSQQL